MATWDELDNEYCLGREEGEANLELMALTSSDSEPKSDSGLESEDGDEVFSNLSCSDLISCIQDLMSHCQKRLDTLIF